MNNQLLASETFTSGSLSPSKWTVISTQTESQITGSPFVAEPPSTTVAGRQYYSGITWPNDQGCEVTVANLVNSSSDTADIWVRVQSGAYSGYVASFNGTGGGTLYKCVAGVFTSLATLTGLGTFSAGEVISIQVAGAALTVYRNYKIVAEILDTTFTSGSPGFSQGCVTSTANSQIGSWRGYSVIQQDGIWQKQGIILVPNSTDASNEGVANASMLYEAPAQLIVTTQPVYKMWFCNGNGNQVYYAESLDLVNWTRNGSAVIASLGFPFIIKNGTTYYIYGQVSPGGAGNFSRYHSTDGVSWTLDNANVFGLAVSGWDSVIIWYFMPVSIVNGTWTAIYAGGNNTTPYTLSIGVATSSDGLTWVRNAGNPVLTGQTGGALTGSVVHSNAIYNYNGTYYVWFFGNQPGGSGQSGSEQELDPGEGLRYKTTDFIHWTLDSHSAHRSQFYEGANNHGGQAYPNGIFNVGGKTYMIIQSAISDNGGNLGYQLSLAIAPANISQLIQHREDATVQTVQDTFASGLSANWTTISGMSAIQVASAKAEPSAVTVKCGASYAGTFGNDQYAELTVATLGNTSSAVYPAVRVQANGNCYIFQVAGVTASQNANFVIQKVISGTGTTIGGTAAVTPQIGDVFRLTVTTGSNGNPILTAYQNGFTVLVVEDTTNAIPSGGNPGVVMVATSAVTNAQISLWSGGNASVTPTYVPWQPLIAI